MNDLTKINIGTAGAIIQLHKTTTTTQKLQECGNLAANNVINEGTIDPMLAFAVSKRLDVLNAEFQRVLKPHCVAIFTTNYNKNDNQIHGVSWSTQQRKTWDYHNDHELESMELQVKELQERIKKRKHMLENMDSEQVDPLTGIIISPATIKEINEIPVITIPKK